MASLGLAPRSALAGLADIGRGETPSGAVGVFVAERTNVTSRGLVRLNGLLSERVSKAMLSLLGCEPNCRAWRRSAIKQTVMWSFVCEGPMFVVYSPRVSRSICILAPLRPDMLQ